MKKVIAVIISVLATVLVANAELNEVRGITVEYKEDKVAGKYRWGFYFCNTNPFEVYVDAELRRYCHSDGNGKEVYEDQIVEFRSLLLKPNETYIWEPPYEFYSAYIRYKAYTKSSQ